MATILARTTLAPGATVTAVTTGISDIVVHAYTGHAQCTAILAAGETEGYEFRVQNTAVVVAAADSIIIEGRGKEGCEVEVYSA